MSDRELAIVAILLGVLALAGLYAHARPNPSGYAHGMSA